MKMRKDTKTKIAGDSSSRRGFALLITITLLAFLVLLLVSLASLTRVETQVASNNQKMAQARQNAMMALNIAVGQLQKYAGPDNRVTATSDLYTTYNSKPNITGVWSSDANSVNPQMWMVSGSETGASAVAVISDVQIPSVDIANPTTDKNIFLVGDNSVSVKSKRVKVKKVEINAAPGSVPGIAAGETPVVGNYAWWVGDQGVKASVGLADRGDEVTYGPWANSDARKRIRQQIGSGANFFRNNGSTTYGFDPLDTTNVGKVKRVQSDGQITMLSPITSGADLTTYLKTYFHDVSTGSFSVLANTLPGTSAQRGLLRDLSAYPMGLGANFKKYQDFSSYMEPAVEGDLRRRHKMQKFDSGVTAESNVLPSIGFGVSPIVSEFLLRFRVSRLDNNTVTVRSKLYVSLWNPYTSALVPEDIYLEVTGLPTIGMKDASQPTLTGSINLQDPAVMPAAIVKAGTSIMRVKLSFNQAAANGSTADKTSWLPGRVYSWATDSTNSDTLKFYTQDSQATAQTGWQYIVNDQMSPGTAGISLTVPAVSGMRVRLTNAAGDTLANVYGPTYPAVTIGTTANGWKFGFGFRINQPNTKSTSRAWRTITADLRAAPIEAGQLIAFDSTAGYTPSQYQDPINPAALTQYLLFRPAAGTNATSAAHDVPVFELPRQPLLSLGELQHLDLPATKMHAIGNSWGATVGSSSSINANEIYDRFFFSGLAMGRAGPDLSLGQPMPNWNMQVVEGGTMAKMIPANDTDVNAGLTSRYLLQGGGFNINSVSVSAWRATLSRNRFGSAEPFAYAKTSDTTGTQASVSSETFNQDATLAANAPSPMFFRFSQSAQETRDWPSTVTREMSTRTFRQGLRGGGDTSVASVRTLTTQQIDTLATQIVSLLKTRATSIGPIRSMSDFLNPNASFSGRNLFEQAIVNAAINSAEITPDGTVTDPTFPGYGAQTLTSADIMNVLAPYARTRSDTFVIRTYGDAVNPQTAAVEGRAYIEAIVQRFPTPVDTTDLSNPNTEAQPAGAFGRRFKIVSFRWLTPSEI